jgi:hypothetical protein
MAEQIRVYQEEKIQAKLEQGPDDFSSSVSELLDQVEISLEELNQKQISSETFIVAERLFANSMSI